MAITSSYFLTCICLLTCHTVSPGHALARTFLPLRRSSEHFEGNLTAPRADGRSLGCGKQPLNDGLYPLLHNGLMRRFQLVLPKDYVPSSPRSVILGFHGFGAGPQFVFDPGGMDLASLSAAPLGPILVAPEGISVPGLPSGFNGAGSTESPGADGETCHAGTEEYACHVPTCGLGGCRRCWWTSCADDVGFALAVLDTIKHTLCVQPDKVYATGFSGGAQFTFELASNPRSAPFFEAVAIMSGLPHNGFLRFPGRHSAPRLLGVWAGIDATRQDPQYPPLSNIGGRPDKSMDVTYGPEGGFYYSTAENTTMYWAAKVSGNPPSHDGDASQASAYAVSFNNDQLCSAWCAGQVIKCLWQSDLHAPMPNSAQLIWHFFQRRGKLCTEHFAATPSEECSMMQSK